MGFHFVKYIIVMLILNFSIFSIAQIKDIKKESKKNKNDSNKSDESLSSDDSDDMASGCFAGIFSCCFNNGVALAFGLVVENHKSIMNLADKDPTVLSFEARANFALGLHHSLDSNYIYVNYLPGIRGNWGAFSTDFRFNILTENSNNLPNSFTSWEWLFLFNIEPVETFKITFGTGVQSERYSNSYFNEHYIGLKFGLPNGHDYIDADTRFSIHYETGAVPFFEGGVHFKKRIADFNKTYMYITIGGLYQNYYSSHDIWAFQGGLIVNIH